MDQICKLNNLKTILILICLVFQNVTLHAVEHPEIELELTNVADLESAALENDKWHAVLPVLGDEKQYFIATDAGKIYQLHDNEIADSAFFDIKSALNNPGIIALTAIALDPNFHFRDQDGYHTFYTAHTEASKKSVSKLTANNKDIELPFDAVLMRWKLKNINSPTPSISQQHEVMRIAIHLPQEHIQQLSFNPYIEPWHDDFGLLFISLAVSATLKEEALYAGTILRIKPEKYGLQNYITPVNNPFVKTKNIPNEIALITGQEIEHFDWIKKGFFSLLIQLKQQDTTLLVEAKVGDDWRGALPPKRIKKRLPATEPAAKTILYQGRELKNLWGKALRLHELDNTWQLQPISLSSTISSEESPKDLPHNLINNDNNQQVSFSLHQRHNGELLLLEHNHQRLYEIVKPAMVTIPNNNVESSVSQSTNNSAFAFIFFMIFILISYFWYLKRTASKGQHFLHDEWANFDINLSTKSLELYKRHAKIAEKIIKISSIERSELLLNGEIISTVSAEENQAFSNQIEASTLTTFAKEHRLKMVDEKQRKIQLCLTDVQKKRYLICLYFRVGNIRHTKLKYSKVIDKAIDWQWLFAQHINPIATSKRKVLVKTQKPTQRQKPFVATEVNPGAQPEKNLTELKSNTENSQHQKAETPKDSASHIDTKLVAALDKLVALKKQGFLDEDEFDSAKAKILKDLNNN